MIWRARRERPEQFEGIGSSRFNTYGVEDGVGVMLDTAVPLD